MLATSMEELPNVTMSTFAALPDGLADSALVKDARQRLMKLMEGEVVSSPHYYYKGSVAPLKPEFKVLKPWRGGSLPPTLCGTSASN